MKKTKLLTLLASMFLLAGCGSSEPEVEPVEIFEVKVNPSAVEVRVGEASKNVNYNVFGKGDFSKEVEISSLDETIATVKKADEGLSFAISPVKEGQTTVTVKSKADETKAANVAVTVLPEKIIVVDPEITSVTASSTGFELAIGSAPQNVTVTVEGKGEYNKGVDVTVSDPEIISIDKTELVSGESFNVSAGKKGNAEVRVTSKQDKTKGAIIPVLVTGGGILPEEVDIVLDATRKELKVSESFDLGATVTGTSESVSWVVEGTDGVIALSNTSDTGAIITGIEVGEATVKASVDGKSAKCRVTVSEPDFYTGIQMKLNDSETIDMVKSAYIDGQPYLAQYTHAFDNIEKDTRVDFYGKLSGAYSLINEDIGPSPDDFGNLVQNNLKPATQDDIDWTVLKTASNVTLYFEIYEEGCSFWLQGGPEIETPKAHLKGIGGDWTTGLEMKINTEKTSEFYLQDVEISTEDEFKVNFEDVWAGYANVQDDALPLVHVSDSDGNIMVNKSGKYNIYWDSAIDGDPAKSIWIEKAGQEEVVYTLTLNDGDPITLSLDEGGMPVGPVHQYSTNEPVSKDDVVKFYADGELITSIGVDREGTEPKPNNNVLESDGLFVIHNDYSPEDGHKSIYLKEYTDGYSIWGSGYEETPAVYSMKLNGGEMIALSLDDDGKPTDALHQYSTAEPVEQGDIITFYKDGTLITSIGVDREGTDPVPGNNVVETLGSFVIHNDYSPEDGDKSIYLKEYEGGYSIWGAGYEDAPVPELTGYQVKIGETVTPLDENKETPSGLLEQYVATFESVKGGDSVGFYAVYDIGEPILISTNISANPAGDNENNIAPLTSGGTDWAVVQDANNVTLYFEVRDGGFGFWLEGGPVALTGYYIVVNGDYVKLEETDPFEDYSQYKVENLDLYDGDVIKVYNANTKEQFSPTLDLASSNKIEALLGEYHVSEDGNFDVYLKIKLGSDIIYFGENISPSPDPVYTVKLNGGDPITLSLDEDAKPIGTLHQYSTDVAVTKDDELVFYKDEVEITNIGVDSDDSGIIPYNNVQNILGKFVIHNDCTPDDGHKSIYLKEYTDGYSIWGTGYVDDPAPTVTGYEVKVEGVTVPLTEVEETPAGLDAQYKATLFPVEAGDRVDFYATYSVGDPTLISTNISPNGPGTHENNLAPATDGGIDWTVVKDASSPTLYLEVRDGGFGFWLEGGPEVLTGFYLKVNDDVVKLEETDPFEGYTQYLVQNLDLSVGDTLKVYNADEKVEFCPALQEGSSDKFTKSTDVIEVTGEGNFDIYLKLKYGGDLIYISENVEPVKSITFAKSEYNATVGVTSLEVGVTCVGVSGVTYESSDTCVTIDASSDDTKVVFNAVSKGTAVITASAEDGAVTAVLTVNVGEVPEPDVRTLYLTDSRSWGAPYVYMWGETESAPTEWPGDPLTFDHVNGDGQNVYKFTVDVSTYDSFVFSGNGEQTIDISFSDFGPNNACWVKDDKTGDKYKVGYWNYVEPEPVKSIEFALDSVEIVVNEGIDIPVTATNVSNISYASDNDVIARVDGSHSDDTKVSIVGLTVGETTITASAEGAEDAVLSVKVVEEKECEHAYSPTSHYCAICGELDPNYCEVRFEINSNTYIGQDLYLAGDFTTPTWGDGRIAMEYVTDAEYHWQAAIVVPKNTTISYKIIMVQDGKDHWMDGSDRTQLVDSSMTIHFEYNFNY